MKLTITVERRDHSDYGVAPYQASVYEGAPNDLIIDFPIYGVGDSIDPLDAIANAIGDWEKQTGKEI